MSLLHSHLWVISCLHVRAVYMYGDIYAGIGPIRRPMDGQ